MLASLGSIKKSTAMETLGSIFQIIGPLFSIYLTYLAFFNQEKLNIISANNVLLKIFYFGLVFLMISNYMIFHSKIIMSIIKIMFFSN